MLFFACYVCRFIRCLSAQPSASPAHLCLLHHSNPVRPFNPGTQCLRFWVSTSSFMHPWVSNISLHVFSLWTLIFLGFQTILFFYPDRCHYLIIKVCWQGKDLPSEYLGFSPCPCLNEGRCDLTMQVAHCTDGREGEKNTKIFCHRIYSKMNQIFHSETSSFSHPLKLLLQQTTQLLFSNDWNIYTLMGNFYLHYLCIQSNNGNNNQNGTQ